MFAAFLGSAIFVCLLEVSGAVDVYKVHVSGPGLDRRIALPVRYLYVQVAFSNGTNCTRALDGQLRFKVVNARTKQIVAAKTDLINRHDGSYIARYRLWQSIETDGLELSFTHNENLLEIAHLNGPSLIVQPPIYAEECDCPVRSYDSYNALARCFLHVGPVISQIKNDLSRLESAISKSELHNRKAVSWSEVMDEAMRRFDQPKAMAVVRYVIRDGQLYRKTLGEYVGFTMFSDPMMLSLLRKVALPDTEFIFNLGDYPLSRAGKSLIVPVVSWCGSSDTLDLVVPTYDVTQAVLESMRKVSIDLHTIQEYDAPEFGDRDARAIFRGRDSQPERLRAAELSVANPDLLDARLTRLFFFNDRYSESKHGKLESPIGLREFFNYRYQLNLDGTVAAYRFPFLLFGGSLVLKQQSRFYEHYYAALANGTHYLSLQRDLDDLVELVTRLRSNEIGLAEQRRMASAGQEFARSYLTPLSVFCYYGAFFDEYTRFIKRVYRFNATELDVSGMEPIGQPTKTEFGHPTSCNCARKAKAKAKAEAKTTESHAPDEL